jgi:hypothetical protein
VGLRARDANQLVVPEASWLGHGAGVLASLACAVAPGCALDAAVAGCVAWLAWPAAPAQPRRWWWWQQRLRAPLRRLLAAPYDYVN